MKKLFKFCSIIFSTMLIAVMVGTCESQAAPSAGETVQEKHEHVPGAPLNVYYLHGQSHTTAGTFTYKTTDKICGIIKHVIIYSPDNAYQPSDNWDITISDSLGVDILAGKGANIDRSTVVSYAPMLLDQGGSDEASNMAVCDRLSIAITNLGNSKHFKIMILYK